MRIKWLLLAVMLFVAPLALAQTTTAKLTAQTTTCNDPGSCVGFPIINQGSVTFGVSGTFSATLQFEVSNDNGATWNSPPSSALSVTSTTTTGTWQGNFAAYTNVRVRCSTYASGTAVVTVTASPVSARSGGGSATPSGPAGGCLSGTYPNPTGGQCIAPNQNVIYVSPNCGTQTNCFQSVAGDNATVFANATAALANLSLVGTPTVEHAASNNCASCTSVALTISVGTNDTALVWVAGFSSSDTISVTDNSSTPNIYRLVVPKYLGTTVDVEVFATNPQAAQTASTITVTDGTARALTVSAITVSNVGAYRFLATPNATGSSSTSLSLNNPATLDANNLFLLGGAWYSGGTAGATASSGTLQSFIQATATTNGSAIISQSAATAATSVTNTATLGASSGWDAAAIELRSHSEVIPTFDVGQGSYNYTSGLAITYPATVQGEPGAVLNYMGSAHAMDIGPSTLTVSAEMSDYVVRGLKFIGGKGMTQGIYLNRYVETAKIKDNFFLSFGNSAAYDVYGNCDNWDIELSGNHFEFEDLAGENIFIDNGGACDDASYARIHDNFAACWQGQGQGGGCNGSQTGAGFVLNGAYNTAVGNNMAYFNPSIWVNCTNSPCYGNIIAHNLLEEPVTSGTRLPPIQFSTGNDGLVVDGNSANVQTSASFMGPRGGTDVLTDARIINNTLTNLSAATPLVALNNVSGNTGNQSRGNVCNAAGTAGQTYPCPLLHTAGGSINQWNPDTYLTCTMSSGTCTATFSQTYGVAPKCTASWNGTGTLTGILKVVPSTTNVVVTSTVGSDSDAVQINCSSGDAQ